MPTKWCCCPSTRRARPIPGITSEIIARRVAAPCRIVDRDHLADEVAAMDTDVVINFGAGNIDACCPAWRSD